MNNILYFKRYKHIYNFKTLSISKTNHKSLIENGLPIVPFGPIYFYPKNVLELITFNNEEYLLLAYLSDLDTPFNFFCIKNNKREDGVYSCWTKNNYIKKQPVLINDTIDSFMTIFENFHSFFCKYGKEGKKIDKKEIWVDFERLTRLMVNTDNLSFTSYFWREYWAFTRTEWYGEYLLKFPNPVDLEVEDKNIVIELRDNETNITNDNLPF